MTEFGKQKFSIAVESIKQLLLLATGVLTLTITFKTNLIQSDGFEPVLFMAYAMLLASLYFGLTALQTIVMVLEDAEKDEPPPTFVTLFDDQVGQPASRQTYSFCAGLALLAAYALSAFIKRYVEDSAALLFIGLALVASVVAFIVWWNSHSSGMPDDH